MSKVNSVVAIYQTHSGAKEAVKELQRDGVDTARGSMVTHSEAGWVIATDKASRLNVFIAPLSWAGRPSFRRDGTRPTCDYSLRLPRSR
jgi:hypothetical protein